MDWTLKFIITEWNLPILSFISDLKSIKLFIRVLVDFEDNTGSVSWILNNTFVTIETVIALGKSLKNTVNIGHIHSS